jgi:hypothetical protein
MSNQIYAEYRLLLQTGQLLGYCSYKSYALYLVLQQCPQVQAKDDAKVPGWVEEGCLRQHRRLL